MEDRFDRIHCVGCGRQVSHNYGIKGPDIDPSRLDGRHVLVLHDSLGNLMSRSKPRRIPTSIIST